MQSYRKRIVVQMQPIIHKPKEEPVKLSTKKLYSEVRSYLLTAIRMYQTILKHYEPLSDEWAICQNYIFKYKTDFELLKNGSYEERKEVIEKYGR